MAKYLLLALNGPTKGPGDAAALVKWYDEVHLPELRAMNLVRNVRRYRTIRGKMPGIENWPHLILCEFETDDLDALLRRFPAEVGPVDATFDKSTSANLWAVQISED